MFKLDLTLSLYSWNENDWQTKKNILVKIILNCGLLEGSGEQPLKKKHKKNNEVYYVESLRFKAMNEFTVTYQS